MTVDCHDGGQRANVRASSVGLHSLKDDPASGKPNK